MDASRLPKLTKAMYDSQEKWCNKNWSSTLEKHSGETEKLLEKINIFDIWSNALQDSEPAKKLIPEIFVDAYMAIHFASMALYKYAYMCLRSQLETVLRLVYFSAHSIEFGWWLEENEWYRSGLKTKDVWGEGYNYFANIKYIKDFDKKCGKGGKLFTGKGNKIRKIYSKLSKYVHSSAKSLQTTPESFSPKYKIGDFKRWANEFTEIQDYVNIILILSFPEKFEAFAHTEQRRLLEIGIGKREYGEIIRDIIDKEK